MLAAGDITTITSAISTVGFPIFCCLAMGWYTYQQSKQSAKQNDALLERLDTMNKDNLAIISENTKTLQELCTLLKSDKKGDTE